MSGQHEDEGQEGWAVPVRLPFLVAGCLLLVLTAAVLVTGRIYVVRLAPSTRPPAISFPAPRLETVRSYPGEPHRPPVPVPPANIARAMAETARSGDGLWGDVRP